MKEKLPFAIKLLRAFCPPHLLEEIEGDLLQKFESDVKLFGERKAKRRLLWNVLRFFQPEIILRRPNINHNPFNMLVANFYFAFRHLWKQKFTTAIHLAGLTMGIAVCFLIALFINHHASFDGFHKNASRTYRVNSSFTEGEMKIGTYATPIPLVQTLRNNVSGIESAVLVRPLFKTVVEVGPEKLFNEDRILITEPQYFDIFNITLLKGHSKNILGLPYQAILSESTARKFFGTEEPMGKVIKLKSKFEFTVVGVMQDAPSNTSLPASILLSYPEGGVLIEHGDTWYFGDFPWVKLQSSTYVLLKSETDFADVQNQIHEIANTHINANPALNEKIKGQFDLQRLLDIHFDPEGGGPWVKAISKSWLLFFAGIGFIVLVLACVNFLNLSTAKAATRAKEVGIRKSIGALRHQLITQFLSEGFVLVFLSSILSLIIVAVSLESVNRLLGQSINVENMLGIKTIAAILIAVVSISFLSGIYPAWFISKFNPTATLKANFAATSTKTANWVRRSLVMTQFLISTILVITVFALEKQVSFMYNKDLGFDKENVVSLEVPNPRNGQALGEELLRLPGVKDVSLSRSSPISTDHWWNSISQASTSDQRFPVCAIYGDEKFYSFYGLKLLSGRFLLSDDFIPDSLQTETTIVKVVVNEKLLNTLGLGKPHEAIGKQFWWGRTTEIVGVVADFHTEPLKYALSPTLIAQHPDYYEQINVKLEQGSNQTETLYKIEDIWKKLFPEGVFESKFLDDQIQNFYLLESKIYQLFKLFAWLAITISCLGLWGLVTFMVNIRTKEIGIRKVLGATVRTIAWLLSKDFVITITSAFIIATPLAYSLLNWMLSKEAYRISPGWDVFAFSALAIVAAVISTVAIRILQTAKSNPVNALKNE